MPLVDTGLVCRYYIDEAASGTTPTQVDDSSSNAYHLTTINYGSGNLAYTEISGQRGLESTSTAGTQRAVRAIDNTSDALRDACAGQQKFTLEVVVRGDSFASGGGRIFGINGRTGQNGELILKATSTTEYSAAFNDSQVGANFSPGLTTKGVLHFVIDTTNATEADRIKYSVNGGTLVSIGATNAVALNETLALGSNLDLIMFNRESSSSFDRSFDGVLFYAAIYANYAFTQSNCENNYDILILDDDEPAAGGNISVANVALTLTTFPVTIEKNISVNTVALTLTSNSIELTKEILINSVALSITPNSIIIGKDISVDNVALTLTTYPITIGSAGDISVNSVALTLTSYPIIVEKNIQIASVGLNLTTNAITLEKNVQINSQSFSITPNSIVIGKDIQIDSVPLTITSYPVSFGAETNIEVAHVALNLISNAIEIGKNINIDSVGLNFTVYAPTVSKQPPNMAPVVTANSEIKLFLGNVPQVDDAKTYEALLNLHNALEGLLAEINDKVLFK